MKMSEREEREQSIVVDKEKKKKKAGSLLGVRKRSLDVRIEAENKEMGAVEASQLWMYGWDRM